MNALADSMACGLGAGICKARRAARSLTPFGAATLVLQTHALVISITQLASPPPVIARVMAADPSLHMMQIDFEAFLALTLKTLVRGTLGACRT